MEHPLFKWKKTMMKEDYVFFIKYIENAKHNLPNNKLLLFLGDENCTKRLIDDISNYLGDTNCTLCDTYGCAFLKPIVKLVYIPGINDYQPKFMQQLANIVQYGQSVIADTCHIDKINKLILDNSKSIKLL